MSMKKKREKEWATLMRGVLEMSQVCACVCEGEGREERGGMNKALRATTETRTSTDYYGLGSEIKL